jgi:alpha-aminoadipic semialdehyde synthase
MRNSLIVGILRETKGWEHRAPLVPSDVEWLVNRGIGVEVERSPGRIFNESAYKKNGARIVDKVRESTLLVGIKEPRVHDLHAHKVYLVFSHTAKGQIQNMPLLRACIRKNITLIDYEKIVDLYGSRLVFFGRFAGICGMVDSLHYMGKKMEWKGINNPFSLIKPARDYASFHVLKKSLLKVDQLVQKQGIPEEMSPFIVGITGHGNVSRGVQEVLELLNPVEIHPENMNELMEHPGKKLRKLFKVVFLREEKFRSRDGTGFYFEEYLKNPKNFESNMSVYLPHITMFIHTSYWDRRFPRLVTKKMVHELVKKKPFRLEFIGDISCDLAGAVELTYKTTTPVKPTYTYDPFRKKYKDGYKSEGVTILAVDNLPAEMPADASDDFSGLIRDYVYQIAAHGVTDITNYAAIPLEIRHAVVTQTGSLTENSHYLKKFL